MKKAVFIWVLMFGLFIKRSEGQDTNLTRQQISASFTSANPTVMQSETAVHSLEFERSEKYWKGVRTGGRILTAAGAVCIIVGLTNITRTVEGKGSGDAGKRVVGIMIPLGGGAVAAASGAIMWGVSGSRLRKLRNNVSISVSSSGAGIVYKL